mmetsp:Transcript_7240/g.19389  ORF Transcript_7240/g.19389 Transcript_7240/m.19389 type:complete len:149 (+) Transcript_7240:92-538(+)
MVHCDSMADRIKIRNLIHPSDEADHASKAKSRENQGSSGTNRKTRRFWSIEENEVLTRLIERHGASNWAKLAESFDNCSAAQLRAHWAHTLSDTLSGRPYTAEEDAYILRMRQRIGNRWSKIAAGMEHRTGNGIKNRFRTLSRTSANL